MGIVIIHDGARVTLGCSDACESMDLVGDVGLNISRTDASGCVEDIMEVTPLAPDFLYVAGTLADGQCGWFYPCYMTSADAAYVDSIYTGNSDADGSVQSLSFQEYPDTVFYMPAIVCASPQPTPSIFEAQLGTGSEYV